LKRSNPVIKFKFKGDEETMKRAFWLLSNDGPTEEIKKLDDIPVSDEGLLDVYCSRRI